MKEFIFANGVDAQTDRPLWDQIPFDDFLRSFRNRMSFPREEEEKRLASTGALATELGRFRAFASPNLSDPLAVGYGVITSPGGVALLDGPLAPLLRLRGVKPEQRLVFDYGQVNWWGVPGWVDQHFKYQDRPYYWLLVGDPAEIPFDLQWILDTGKATGRVAFETTDQYGAYVERIVTVETALRNPTQPPPAFFWAPQHDKVTRQSNWYMADPLVASLKVQGHAVTYREEGEATVDAFWTAAERWGARPGLVYTASHGQGVDRDDPNQIARQGSLRAMDGSIDGDSTAQARGAFPGCVLFNFACYSGGTPSHSDLNHWVPEYNLDVYIPQTAFVSSLHRRLLAHPRGPLACIGHVEPACIHSFLDPADPEKVVPDTALDVEWGERMRPFRTFVNRLMSGATVGYAMEEFGFLYNSLGNDLATGINRLIQMGVPPEHLEKEVRRLATTWISRNDYQNYVVFGDPAARIA